jgi:uncharacterized membrane protein
MDANTSRLESFSDGVFAVAITLLVLQITVPEVESGQLFHALLNQWPQFATYAASFLTIGVIWVNHHTAFTYLARTNRTLQFLNLILLLFVVLVPFPTALLGRYLQAGHDAQVAAATLGVVMTLMGISFGGLWVYAVSHPRLLISTVDLAKARATIPRFTAGSVVYAVSIGLAWVSPILVVALYAALAIYYAFNQILVPQQTEED